MADQAINSLVVSASILDFIQNSAVNDKADYMPPAKFDANAEDKTAWFQAYVPSIAQSVGRLGVGSEWTGTLRCEAYARSQDSRLMHLQMISDVQDALCQEHVLALDPTTSGNPTLGLISIYEPVVQDRGAVGAYQCAVMICKFKVTRTA